MIKKDVLELIAEVEGKRKAELEKIDVQLEDAKEKEAAYSAQVEKALDSGDVTDDTALAELNLRAQRRRIDRLNKERQELRAVPLFSVEESRHIVEGCRDGYQEEWNRQKQRLQEIAEELGELEAEISQSSNDFGSAVREIRNAITRNGVKVSLNPVEEAGNGPYVARNHYQLNSPTYAGDFSTKHVHEAVQALKEVFER